MRHYEVVFLVHPDQSDQVPGMVERYQALIERGGGTVHRMEDWGRRQLTFPVNKIHKAHYILMNIEVNGETRTVDADPEMPLLWVLRDELGLTGTKFGCGVALCGACTVHMNGVPVRSCQTRLGQAEGAAVTTIEALDTPESRALRQAWQELDVPQCGYCQSGQIMSAARLLVDSRTGGTMRSSMLEVWREAGLDPQSVFEELAKERDKIRPGMQRNDPGGPVRGFIIPSLKSVGLFSERLEGYFREMFEANFGERGRTLEFGSELPKDLDAWLEAPKAG